MQSNSSILALSVAADLGTIFTQRRNPNKRIRRFFTLLFTERRQNQPKTRMVRTWNKIKIERRKGEEKEKERIGVVKRSPLVEMIFKKGIKLERSNYS